MKSIMKWTGIVLGGLIGLALLVGVVLYPIGMEKLTRSYPGIRVEAVNIPTDPDAVARGKHVAIIWGCAKCHGEDLSGTLLADDPFLGTIPASNLTSGKGGIAKSYTDADWIRAIRHGVKPNSRVEIFMYDYYSTMSDQDLGALIAYLKQIPPVDSDYPAMRFGSVFPIALAVGLFTPAAELIDHGAPRPADPVPGATKEYGRYLSALCTECHGTNLAGKLGKWKQEDFIRAVRTGVLPDGKQLRSAMSSKTYGEMNDTELAALWLYLQGLPPVKAQK
jgi:mono/diheme cytochrome c family protein